MKKMRDFIIGFIGFLVGVTVVLAYIYGPGYLIALGSKTEEVGKKLEDYKKPVQDAAKGLFFL